MILFVLAIPLAYAAGVVASWGLDDGCGDVLASRPEGSSSEVDWSWVPPHTVCRVDTATSATVYYESWETAIGFFAFFLLLAGLVLAPARRTGRAVAVRSAIAVVATVAVVAFVFL